MKLNDPFGRMASRHQLGYEAMRDTLRKNGINTASEAMEIIDRSKKRAVQYISVAVVVLLLLTVISIKWLPVTFSLGVFFSVWIITSTTNGQRYIKRYIDEDLANEKTHSSGK
ncbi:hypothetical protein [Desulforhopalus sp. 52FAK]